MKTSKTSLEAQFGPLQKKTFASALSLFFEQQCPQMGGHLTRQVLVNNVKKLVDEFYPPNTNLRMGQVMWPAVDEREQAAYGKTIGKTKIKPVFVDMIAPEDIEATLQGQKKMQVRQRATIRLFQQAKQQGGVLTGVDVATMMRLSPATISRYVVQWEKEHQTSVPRRGTIHDMGRSVTHKRQICYKMIVEGKSVEQTARETNHSPEAVTRYVKDYKRILACLHKGLTPTETSFVAKVSESLVFEYVNLIQENQVDIKEQMEKNEISIKDIPF
jgi:DNA-binding CsgD family transcriptional regulator